MLQKKGGRGFPYCVFMDSEGTVLKELRPSDEASFRSGMKPVGLLVSARSAVAKKSNKKNKGNLALIEAVFDPNEEDFKTLSKFASKKSAKKEIVALFNAMVETWPIRKAIDGLKGKERDEEANKALNEKLYGFYQNDLVCKDAGADLFDRFWIGVIDHSIVTKDKKSGVAALEKIEAKYKDNPRAMNYFKGKRTELGV